MKKKTTKEILAESFMEITTHKSASRITVNDIVNNCGMSPATFYRYFRDKYELIAWIYEQRCNEIAAQTRRNSNWRKKLTEAWISYCYENRLYLVNVITSTAGYDSFIQHMVDKHIRFIENEIITSSGEGAVTDSVHMKIYLHSSGAIRLMFAWLTGKVSATAEEFGQALMDALPNSIVKLMSPP